MAGLHGLILAGGRGTRLWPLSRKQRPKQLLPLHQGKSLLRHTIDRLAPLICADDLWICTTADLATAVTEQAPDIDPERILLEPVGRNTAPAIAWAASQMVAAGSGGPVVVLPSDHWVADGEAFRRALEIGRDAVDQDDTTVTLGVVPEWPETGYGYVELGQKPNGPLRAYSALGFVEKPDLDTARALIAGGRHLWNAGIFLFRSESLLAQTRLHLPHLAAGLDSIAANPGRVAELYSTLPAISIDTGIMEKLDRIHCVPLDCGWSDLGSLAALADILPQLESGSRAGGDVVEIDGANNLLFAETGTIATLGVEGLVVVRTNDAVVVLPRERAQEVRAIVDQLEQARRSELL